MEPGAEGPIIAGRDLHKRFGEGEAAVDALRGVSLELFAGTFAAIMGRSGSGKSTLMHLLAALDQPTSGEVWLGTARLSELGDEELTRLRRLRFGFVFQNFNLIPALDVEENVLLPLRISGSSIDRGYLGTLLERLELVGRRRHRPGKLSGGEQQRVAIARAMITRPLVIFADEPTGNLDTASSDAILELLRDAVRSMGQTAVMVTHDPVAAAFADRLIFLRDGVVVRESGRLGAASILESVQELA